MILFPHDNAVEDCVSTTPPPPPSVSPPPLPPPPYAPIDPLSLPDGDAMAFLSRRLTAALTLATVRTEAQAYAMHRCTFYQVTHGLRTIKRTNVCCSPSLRASKARDAHPHSPSGARRSPVPVYGGRMRGEICATLRPAQPYAISSWCRACRMRDVRARRSSSVQMYGGPLWAGILSTWEPESPHGCSPWYRAPRTREEGARPQLGGRWVSV